MRRILTWVPILFILFLVQSYFWVPTYEEQTRGNPERLTEYIEASIGDAQILNPILSADSASSTIESRVFEGLIDRDEDLKFRGRLATHWEIFEEAYFYVNDEAWIPNFGKADSKAIIQLLRDAIQGRESRDGPVSQSLANIEDIEALPARSFEVSKEERGTGGATVSLTVRVTAPPRIRLHLREVDQELFDHLSTVLGKEYFSSFDGKRFIEVSPEALSSKKAKYAREFLPATEHNPVIVFHLRPNVKFHDGHVFDAEDVRFTYEAIMNPKNLSPRISDYEPVKAVEILDPLTIRIVYKRLYSPALGTWAMGILPAHLLNAEVLREEGERRGMDPEKFSLRQSQFSRRPIGCGPFRFREWKTDQYILLDRFEDYWEGPPNYERYTFRIVPDLLTQEMEFYAGTVDSYGVQPHQVERLGRDPNYQNFTGLAFGYTYIAYNMRREPFTDRRVRQALGMAIDVDKIIRYVLYNQGERITGPFVKQTDFYNHAIETLPYDPEGALELLAEAGWKKGPDGWLEKDGERLRFTLITNQGNNIRQAILSIAQDSWRKIGIDVRTDVLEWAVFIQERVNKFDFDALILGWAMGIEPDLYQIWHSSQTRPNQLNFVAFQDQEADDLIIKIRQEYNHERQVRYAHRLHEIIAKEQPYTFLYVSKWTAILDRRIVIKEVDSEGEVSYSRIKPTKTGNYGFHFNKWIKLPEIPRFEMEG
ncbi:MAG: peptide ABC transporter substrate-binding protein [Proteobacteria bacterium]|nr:peptide ABC transporter substrate-binding protein [Pseudomonadota bacterium]NIS71392.1 peptide ABC transporter substrate-binding protein [Pseudomonadota bacterium]